VLLLESEPASGQSANLSLTDIRRFIFDRLNTGGTKLNYQEIRNAIYPGHFNDALINLSRFHQFTDTFDIPPYTEADPNDYYENEARQKNTLYSSMADCQLVLRYFALKDDGNIRGSMRSMLDRAMEQRTKISKADALVLEEEFKSRFTFLYSLFGGKPFRLPPTTAGGHVFLRRYMMRRWWQRTTFGPKRMSSKEIRRAFTPVWQRRCAITIN
jgi:hypothetical protein